MMQVAVYAHNHPLFQGLEIGNWKMLNMFSRRYVPSSLVTQKQVSMCVSVAAVACFLFYPYMWASLVMQCCLQRQEELWGTRQSR